MKSMFLVGLFFAAFCLLSLPQQADAQMRSHSRRMANTGRIFHVPSRGYEAVGMASSRSGVRAAWRRSSSPIHNAAAFRPMRCVRRNGQVYCTSRWR